MASDPRVKYHTEYGQQQKHARKKIMQRNEVNCRAQLEVAILAFLPISSVEL